MVDTYIYVQASDGTPLMPTKRKHHIQKLLKRRKAVVVEHVPFVIQLKYDGPKNTQPLFGGTDPGRNNIGNAVVNENGTVIYNDHVTTKNHEIPKFMAERRDPTSQALSEQRSLQVCSWPYSELYN